MMGKETLKRMMQNKLTSFPAEWTWEEAGIVFMQFLGLQDDKGVDIFEGDIIECWDDGGSKITGVIEYDGVNCFSLKTTDELFINNWVNAEHINVLGNIHEHRYLLK